MRRCTGSCRWGRFLHLCPLRGTVGIFISFTSVCLEEAQNYCTLIRRLNSHGPWTTPSLFFCLTLSPTQLLFLLFTEESHSSHLLFKILVFLNLCPSAMGWGDWHVCVFLYGCRSFAFKPADSDSGLIHLNNRLLVGNVLIKMKEQRRY